MVNEKTAKVLSRLQALCSRQECCSSDVMKKALKALDGDEDAASAVVAELVHDRFVDDLRYASAFAREKSSLSGWGARKITYALMRKGIDGRTASEALGDVDGDASSRKLESVVAAKYRLLASDPQCRLKLLRFVLGRGYGYDEANAAIDKVLRG